jgi:hypothetical protein
MTYISIKLLALAVICGCALLSFAVADGGKELVGFLVLTVTGIWFVAYWLLCAERKE